MNLQPYLDFATSLAYRAGKITLGHFNTDVHVNIKENNDPVTIADHDAENFIRGEIIPVMQLWVRSSELITAMALRFAGQ